MNKIIQLNKEGEDLFPINTKTIINSNGTALKYADGTMICYTRSSTTDINQSSGYSTAVWEYPEPFANIPTVVATVDNWSTIAGIIKAYASKSTCLVMVHQINNNFSWYVETTNFNIVAYGRWK